MAQQYGYGVPPSEIIYNEEYSRIRGFRDDIDKDFVIGGLFALHNSASGSSGGRCGTTIIQSGAERAESFLYALDLINNDTELLPGIVLGYDIRDTCISENIALDEAIQMIYPETGEETVMNATTDSIVAMVGPTISQVALSVASLLRLFTVPEVSYSASSPTLSNRDRYGYFYRTHPSDSQEVLAIIDLALANNWTYVSLVHSNNAYGEPAIDIFRRLAIEVGICINLDIGLNEDFKDEDYFYAANRLVNESDASVVIVYASLAYVEGFMEQLSIIQYNDATMNGGASANRFVWIGSSSWTQAVSISTLYPHIIEGVFGMEASTNMESNFRQYLSELTLNSNKRNPWFLEYYQDYYNCTVNISCSNNIPITSDHDYNQRDYVELVIDAVYSIAHALNDFMSDNCDRPIQWESATQTCVGQSKLLNGTELRNYLSKVNFTSPSGNRVEFDSTGNVNGTYKIVNFQKDESNQDYRFVTIGTWTAIQGIRFKDNVRIQFGIEDSSQVKSQCQQCPEGSYIVGLHLSCCGLCEECTGRNYTRSSLTTECSACPDGTWGNTPLQGSSGCQDIPEVYLNPSDPFGIVIILLGISGVIGVILVAIGMGIFWKTPVIKSSGREQMILILTGICISFLVTALYLVRPSFGVCLAQRFSDTLPFTLMLSALLIKLVRITRIFLNKGNTKTRFIDWKYQIVFTIPLLAVQILLIVISLIIDHPGAVITLTLNPENTLDTPTNLVRCASTNIAISIIQILYNGLLLVVTNFMGVMTVQFPSNFNESRYVTFATLSMFLIWLSYLQAYFATSGVYQVAILPFTLQLAAFAVLICFFVTRIYKATMEQLLKDDSSNSKTTTSSKRSLSTYFRRQSTQSFGLNNMKLNSEENSKENKLEQ